jgi:hypothetical protein
LIEESKEGGALTFEVVKREIAMRYELLNPEDTWREISISLTGESKEGGALTFEVVKRE